MTRCIARLLPAFVVSSVLVGCASSPEQGSPATASATTVSAEPVNAICPIGKEPVTANGGTLVHGEHTVAFCCTGCQEYFEGLPDSKKDEFVELALIGEEMEFED